ncbi:OprD family outer membrane porin [Pseudomonas sp. FW300-N2C3]|uniref:OprD family outer membrane porin n=1 Tax=Pseudomonas sp. FW300-N2C3 TaxID=2751317 RepID=UPI00287059AA|nr:OprD family outer membrane porin [Pseudomonas sp. FW300-N2C3]
MGAVLFRLGIEDDGVGISLQTPGILGTVFQRAALQNALIQNGPLKNLSFRLRQATYRNSFSGDVDDVRFITQYPINCKTKSPEGSHLRAPFIFPVRA